MPRKDPGMPYDLAPMLKARFGQPDDCADLVNKYGTYNIQPTSDTENLFPLIAPGLPEQWKRMAVGFPLPDCPPRSHRCCHGR